MNNLYLDEYIDKFERILSLAYEYGIATPSIERLISYSTYFQNIEKDRSGFAPIISDSALINSLFPDKKIDLTKIPVYNQCLWAAESYLRIQGETRLTFECIFLYIPISKMYDYFPLYHEMDFSHIINEFKRLFMDKSTLGLLIDKYRYSLSDIAKDIGASKDMLSSLKLRRRNIEKANVETVSKLAHRFNVRIETISELTI